MVLGYMVTGEQVTKLEFERRLPFDRIWDVEYNERIP